MQITAALYFALLLKESEQIQLFSVQIFDRLCRAIVILKGR
jgi:hypothetical protein